MTESNLKAQIIEIDNQLVRAVNNSHPNWVIEEEEEKEEKKISQAENQKLQMS